jgi:mono/diheme cytochrome c family protein
MKFSTLPLAAVFVALLLVAPSGQAPRREDRPNVISSLDGRDLFQFYCAACHGPDGWGGGPVVPALNVRPPDLTTIATRNGGTFPQTLMEVLVTGDQTAPMPAHGSKDMPVWGPIFRALAPDDRMNKIRIENIVDYLESIQVAK